ncbi:hypothetical protein E2C01_083343 [Portunus trituberculatus]|uniref:Uncharacterized protein n=1 Tax=Portunus trituberculatus TaxID=210409 RepID=A0A5B7IUW5_PORTR|nr:hypothetical protein [Portunus trituberculatus]
MTGREWMVVLLGLCGETNGKMIEAVKEFLERMRCRYKGQTQKKFCVTCNIKIKIKQRRRRCSVLCVWQCEWLSARFIRFIKCGSKLVIL